MTSLSSSSDDLNYPLSVWYDPRAWFRTIYWIWFDQVSFWRIIRPRLTQPSLRWTVLLQTIIGATIFSACWVVLPLAIAYLTRQQVSIYWDHLLQTAGYAVFFPAGIGLLVSLTTPPSRNIVYTAALVCYSVAFAISLTAAFVVLLAIPPDRGRLDYPFGLSAATPFVDGLGLALGLTEVVTRGAVVWIKKRFLPIPRGQLFRWTCVVVWIILLALRGITGVFMDWRYEFYETATKLLLPVTMASMVVGYLLGASLGMRQVADDQTRQTLADPS
jgi:hypothetical protein